MKHHREIADLCGAQHGLITDRQLTAIGVARRLVRYYEQTGVLCRQSDHVLRIAGVPDSNIQRAALAVLDVSVPSALSHSSATALYGVPGYSIEPLHVTRLRGGRAHTNQVATVHQPRLLRPEHVTSLFGVAVLTPVRALFDIAASYGYPQFERAVDYALSRKLCSAAELHLLRDTLAGKGRTGMTALRLICDAHPPNETPRDSNLEARFEQICESVGVRGLTRQVHLYDAQGWIARVDFVDPARKIVLECDSQLHHGGLSDVRRDEERDRRLRAAGYRVERFTDTEVFFAPSDVRDRLRAIFFGSGSTRGK